MKAIVQTPTNNLGNSLNFYKKIGFTSLVSDNAHLLSDGKIIIEINPDRFARAGVKLYQSNWGKAISQLEEMTTLTKIEGGHLLSDPSGTWIYLLEQKQENLPDIESITAPVIGQYAGVSLESTAMKTSIQIWEILGFSTQMGGIDQGWISLSNTEGFTVSIMKPMACPHLFFNPSLTYFNGKNNLAIIEKIRTIGIPITEEITHFNKEGIVDNIIIQDPGGLGFFLFSD